jgi:transposase
MAQPRTEKFKEDAVRYYLDHRELGLEGCAKNLGIGHSTLSKWLAKYRKDGNVETRGSGNYASDEQKDIARLQRELRDTKDALDILKKAISILGD